MIIGREECGCEIIQDHDAKAHIEYCPLHKSADDLQHICVALLGEIKVHTTKWDLKMRKLALVAEDAIARARGEL